MPTLLPPAAAPAAVNIHREDLPGDVLIFLTGQDECEAAVRLLVEEDRKLKCDPQRGI